MVVSTLLAGVFVVLCLGLFVDQRRQFATEQAKTETNQNLRLAMDLIGADIRQAGERLESDKQLGKISVIDGANNGPDTLITQRKLVNETLNLCQTITAGSSTSALDVAVQSSAVASCLFSDADGDGLTDNLGQLKIYRTKQDGVDGAARTTNTTSCAIAGGTDKECTFAYIHDPTTKKGEFFVYGFEDTGTCTGTSGQQCNRIYRVDGKPWQNTYTYNSGGSADSQPKIYILEEREYSLAADTNTPRSDDFILQMRLNRQTPVRLANKMSNFQVTATNRQGTVLNSFNAASNLPQHQTNLSEVQYFRVSLSVIPPETNLQAAKLTLSTQFFPRNALSR
jgi:type IV pilus assembly protein PilW